MCVAYVAFNPTPEIELLIVHNRDEYFDRPFSDPEWRSQEGSFVLSGLDAAKGGTWLAVNEKRHVSFVLNIRKEVQRNGSLSRGILPFILLNGDPISSKGAITQYGRFKLVGVKPNRIQVISSGGSELRTEEFSDDQTFSNHDDSQTWWKERRLRSKTVNALTATSTLKELTENLFRVLEDDRRSSTDLPIGTGLSPAVEELLSPIFVAVAEKRYGTVCSSVLVQTKGALHYSHKNHLTGKVVRHLV